MTRTSSLKQLSYNLSLLTLDLWLSGYVAMWPHGAFAKCSRAPENRLRLEARLYLKAIAYSLYQQTHPATKLQSVSNTAIVQLRDAV